METSGLVSAHFPCKLDCLQVKHLGLNSRFLKRKGRGCHNRRIGDGSGKRSLYSVSYVFRSWRRCPFAVARLLGKCLRTRLEVSPGHVVNNPEVMLAVQVETTGLKADRWRYWTMSNLAESVWTLFENGECGDMGATGDGSMLWRSMQ